MFARITFLFYILAPVIANCQALTNQTLVTIPASYFGLHVTDLVDNTPNNTPWPATPFPVPALRTQNAGIFWVNLNVSEGTYNWTLFDSYMEIAQANGTDVLYAFFQTPPWASSNPTGSCGVPSGTCYPPTSNTYVATFVTALIAEWSRIAPAVSKKIECWNEFDDPKAWAGTYAQMLAVCQTLYQTAKAIDPTILITCPSVTMSDTTSAGVIAAYMALGGANYCDIITFHGYPLTPVMPPPAQVVFQTSNFMTAIQGYNINPVRPVWDTESSWGGDDEASLTADQQVAFVAIWKMLEWSVGVAREYWYGYDVNWGQLWSTTLNSAGIAYEQVYNWMVGAQMLPSPRCNVPNGVVYSCYFARSGGYRAVAVWTSDASMPNYAVPSWATQYHDLTGMVTRGLGSTVTIGAKPILLESGSVF